MAEENEQKKEQVGERQNEHKLFRKSALNSISSADELNTILKVSNPSAWIVVGAFLALAIGLIVWACTAQVPVKTTVKAVVVSDTAAMCWVDDGLADKLRSSDARVYINGQAATGITVGTRPMSNGEVDSLLGGGYLADELKLAEWSYRVDLQFSEKPYKTDAATQGPYLAPADVITAVEHPITLVFGS